MYSGRRERKRKVHVPFLFGRNRRRKGGTHSPVGERHALEKFVQRRLDAQLLGGALVVQRTRESAVEETRRDGDRESGGLLFLVRHRHGEVILVILRLGLEVRHHEVARVYRLPRIPSAVLLPLVVTPGAMKTALARHRRWFPVYQFRLHLGIDPLRTRIIPSIRESHLANLRPRSFSVGVESKFKREGISLLDAIAERILMIYSLI